MEVDHVSPLDQGGDPYRMDNLRGTCADCHQAKTAEENRQRLRSTGGRVPDAAA